jgi:hypothetical protein
MRFYNERGKRVLPPMKHKHDDYIHGGENRCPEEAQNDVQDL